ncbi:hypothetical protein MN608_05979 [Microdochium nivale]|nr:hypothetical protein MN608_05979 [Microdochium nivale]
MASTDCYRGPRRDSNTSSKSRSSSRRPRLLRAAATEPSITTIHSPTGLLTNSNTNRRATDLLNMVVVSKTSYASSPPSSSQSLSSLEAQMRADQQLSGAHLHQSSYSACYFSFPSLDAWEDEEDTDEKASTRTR